MLPARIYATPTVADFRGTSALAFSEGEDAPVSATTSTAFTMAANSEFITQLPGEGSAALLGAADISSGSAQLPDEKPPGTKVPEPASLMLVGSGLLALARASRMKQPRRAVSCATPITTECTVSRKALARQAA